MSRNCRHISVTVQPRVRQALGARSGRGDEQELERGKQRRDQRRERASGVAADVAHGHRRNGAGETLFQPLREPILHRIDHLLCVVDR
jgi:hypothetical protein